LTCGFAGVFEGFIFWAGISLENGKNGRYPVRKGPAIEAGQAASGFPRFALDRLFDCAIAKNAIAPLRMTI
jgi:hypothetical protein